MSELIVEVSFKGEASAHLREAFDCLAITADRGVSHLHITDDPAVLHGTLEQIRALGLELIRVRGFDKEHSPARDAPMSEQPERLDAHPSPL